MESVACKSWVAQIAPYQPGDSELKGVKQVIKLSSNESALGPSPSVFEAIHSNSKNIARYPDPHCTQLRRAIATAHQIDDNWIVCSNGSEEILDLLARAYAGPGDEVLYFDQSFPRYGIASRAVGATPVVVPVHGFQPNVADVAAFVTDRTRIMYVANPNNPTGVWLTDKEVRALRDALPGHVLLVLDAAYAEFVDNPDYGSGFEVVHDYPENTILTRTFSKAYGLAGLRVGWAYGAPDLSAPLHAVRGAFNVNALAQAAAARAVADDKHLHKALTHNAEWKPKLESIITKLGLICPERTAGNFVFTIVPTKMGGAQALDTFLIGRNIITRAIPTIDGLRITIGTTQENQILTDALCAFAEGGSATKTTEMSHG